MTGSIKRVLTCHNTEFIDGKLKRVTLICSDSGTFIRWVLWSVFLLIAYQQFTYCSIWLPINAQSCWFDLYMLSVYENNCISTLYISRAFDINKLSAQFCWFSFGCECPLCCCKKQVCVIMSFRLTTHTNWKK